MPRPSPSSEIILASNRPRLVAHGEIAAAAETLGVRFPAGYEAFLTTYGVGCLSNWVRINPPAKVAEFTVWFRDFLRGQVAEQNWFWDLGGVLEPDRAAETVAIGDTLDGDTIVFHPDDPDVIFALPRHQAVVHRIGRGLDEALDWLFLSGKLTRKLSRRVFVPDTPRDRQDWSIGLPFARVRRGLLELDLHDEVTSDERREQTLEFVVREFGGVVTASGPGSDDEVVGNAAGPDVEPTGIVIERDPGPTTPRLDRLIARIDRFLVDADRAKARASKSVKPSRTIDEVLATRPFTDESLAELATLKGVKVLSLRSTGGSRVTDAGLAHLAGLKSLQFFEPRSSFTDEGMAHLAGLVSLRALHLSGTRITDAGLAHLAGLTRLESLLVDSTAITDEGLAALAGLARLDTFRAEKTGIVGPGLAHLRGTRLQFLDLKGCPIDDRAAPHLAGLANLRGLYLEGSRLTDAGLGPLRALLKLESLDLTRSLVTGPGLAALAGLRKLGSIYLGETGVDDEGLAVLATWPNARRSILHLGGTRITDAGLAHLRGWTRLESLVVPRAGVTGRGVAALKAALPHLRVSRA